MCILFFLGLKKKKFQEERLNLETDKKRLTKELAENHEKIE